MLKIEIRMDKFSKCKREKSQRLNMNLLKLG